MVLGKATSLSRENGDFFPFEEVKQTKFVKDVLEALCGAMKDAPRPVYIRCGRRAVCDYLFFYSCRSSQSKTAQFICMIADAKHSCKNDTSISTADQKQLFKALSCVDEAMKAAKLSLKAVRLVFVTNKMQFSSSHSGSNAAEELKRHKEHAEILFPDLKQEILNKECFDFGPFSDILPAKRPVYNPPL